jgi:hypothetical protein
MRIGIFEGKKAYLNRAVLKLLIESKPLKAWEISKIIAAKKESTYQVYSVLIRKKGRLNELLKKEYISRLPNKQFIPTFKGIIAYLLTEKNPKISSFYANFFSELPIPEKLELPLFNFPITIDKELLQCLKELNVQELLELKEIVQQALSWVDLDAILSEELAILLSIRLNKELMSKIIELLSKFSK